MGDDAALSVPWRDTERLTWASSVMLRMGLAYALAQEDGPTSHPLSPDTPPLSQSFNSSGALKKSLEELSANRQAKVLSELQWQEAVQAKIDHREHRRSIARQRAEDLPRREAQAQRAAMWRTLLALPVRPFWERHESAKVVCCACHDPNV